MAIFEYFIDGFLWLLMAITLMTIGEYFIVGYWWLLMLYF
jgi:hypothetical protein